MRSGCLSLARSEDGLIMRHRVRSISYKGKQSAGEPAEWITIAPVAEAIQVLEHLSARAAAARCVDTLWPVLIVKAGSKDRISAEIVRQLNVYRDHLNALFGNQDVPVIPRGPDGLPWRITTRQFRRTIAWHIANRPFGTIAGMIQYKHSPPSRVMPAPAGRDSAPRSRPNAPLASSTISSPISTSTAPGSRSTDQPLLGLPIPWTPPPANSARYRQ
jgi:hypothetical protein